MGGRLDGRVAIVTGAGQGIGHGVSRALAAEGARLVLANRTRETGEAVAAELSRDFGAQARFVETDVSRESDVRAATQDTLERFGRYRQVEPEVQRWTSATRAIRCIWAGSRPIM